MQLFTIPSGLGGTFTVKVVERNGGMSDVRIHMPRNPDWHGKPLTVRADTLKEVAQ